MQYEIHHKTSYLYTGPVSHCHSKVWLQPRNLPNQKCEKVSFAIEPLPTVFYEVTDFYGNPVRYFAIQYRHAKLSVTVKSKVEIIPGPEFSSLLSFDKPWEEVRTRLSQFHSELVEVYHFKYDSQHVVPNRDLYQFASVSFIPGKGLLSCVFDLMGRVYKEFRFVTGHTTISTPLEVIMRTRKGVCQDFAHLCIAFIRSQGLAARYVSGYIETIPPAGKAKLVGTDASHAWISVFLPGYGWVDFDPTNNLVPTYQHVTIAWGRDYADVSPMKGVVFSTGKQSLQVEVDVKRL